MVLASLDQRKNNMPRGKYVRIVNPDRIPRDSKSRNKSSLGMKKYYENLDNRKIQSERCRIYTGDTLKDRFLRRWYGISESQYTELFNNQNGVCDLCKKPETMTYKGSIKKLAVDHDHKTGKVRSLLCARCNLHVNNMSKKEAYEVYKYLAKHEFKD